VQVLDHAIDFGIRQGIRKRRHDVALGAHSAALVHDSEPDIVVFRRRDGAIREIGKRRRRLEAEDRLRLALAVRTMTGHARRTVDLLAGSFRLTLGARRLRLSRRRADEQHGEEHNGDRSRARRSHLH
jgi:hypothetical protein